MEVRKNQGFEQEIKRELENSDELKRYAEQVKTMGAEELREERARLEDELSDEDEEMRRLIGQTGVHMHAAQVDAYHETFALETAKIKEKKRLVEEALGYRDEA